MNTTYKLTFDYPVLFPPADMKPLEFFRRAKAIGLHAVEWWVPPADFEDLAEQAREAGLEISGFIGFGSLEEGFNNRSLHGKLIDIACERIELARKHGVPAVTGIFGPALEGQPDQEAREVSAEGIRKLVPVLESAEITLNLEALNTTVDQAGYVCPHTEWAADVARRIGHPRVKLLYDIYHMQIMEGNILHNLRKHWNLIGHIHVAGVPGRHEPGPDQELNYPAIARELCRLNYDRYVGFEFVPTKPVLESLQEAVTTLTHI